MIERVFRISKWTKLQNSRWRLKKKTLYDDEAEFKRGAKSYKRMVERSEGGLREVKATFEEFLNGSWELTDEYPPKQSTDR